MTLGQLRDTIAFEGKIQDIDALGGWIDLTISEVLDEYTGLCKYDELYQTSVVIAAAAAVGTITLPSDLQHIDIDEIFFRRGGDEEYDYRLQASRSHHSLNEGEVRYVLRNSSAAGLTTLTVFPYSEIVIGDEFVISYWQKGSARLTSDAAVILPDQLVPVVKRELIARASTFGDSKQAGFYRGLAQEAHVRSYGVTDMGGQN